MLRNLSATHILFGAALVALSLYVYIQTRPLRTGPDIELFAPQAFTTVKRGVDVLGRAPRAQQLYINGESVYITEAGDFSTRTLLTPPLDTLYIEAVNRLGERSTMRIVLGVERD